MQVESIRGRGLGVGGGHRRSVIIQALERRTLFAVPNLTGATWDVTSTDDWGHNWDATTLVFTQQQANANGGANVAGYFDWKSNVGSGRELFSGQLNANLSLFVAGYQLVNPQNIVLATYTATVSGNGQAITNGRWAGGISGGWSAVRIGGGGSPEVETKFGAANVPDNDTTPTAAEGSDFSSVAKGAVAPTRTYTVRNLGTAALTTSGLNVPTGYTIVDGLNASIPAGGSDTFTVRLNTTTAGTFQGNITFTNNDANENPFNFAVKGVVTSTVAVGVVASDASASESAAGAASDGAFTLYRRNGTGSLTLQFRVDGTAKVGTDFTFVGTGVTLAYNATTRTLSATFAAGKTVGTVLVRPINDATAEPVETVQLTLLANPLYAGELNRTVAKVSIADRFVP